MAGVGFELKKLFRKKGGYLGTAKAYTVSAIVTEGPMVLSILMMFSIKRLLKLFGAAYGTQEIYLISTTYIMVFSLLFSNTLLMFVSRYISDCIYQKRSEDILPSFYAVIFYLLIFSCIPAAVYLAFLEIPLLHKALNLAEFAVMLIIWVQMSYLSAIRKYNKLLIGFLESTFLGILSAAVFMKLRMDPLTAAFAASLLAFFVMMALYMQQMISFYPQGAFSLVKFFPELDQYKILVLVGFFMSYGLFGHNFVFWFGEYRVKVLKGMVYCMKYDVPGFYASLTIIPFLVIFVVALEVNFYHAYRKYFDTILHGGTLKDVRTENVNMSRTLFRELAHVFEIQFFVEVIAVTFLGNALKRSGFDQEMLVIYRYLCMGYCFYVLFKSLVIILLYFDDRKGACVLSGLFAFLSTAGSLIGLKIGIQAYGLGFLAAAAVTSVIGLKYLYGYLNRLEYHVFCSQPLFYEDPDGSFLHLARRLEAWEGKRKQKRKGRKKGHES